MSSEKENVFEGSETSAKTAHSLEGRVKVDQKGESRKGKAFLEEGRDSFDKS